MPCLVVSQRGGVCALFPVQEPYMRDPGRGIQAETLEAHQICEIMMSIE